MCSHSARASVGEGVGRRLGRARRLSGQRADDLIGVDRFAEIVVRAGAQRLDRRGDAAVAGEDDDARARREGVERPDQRQPRKPRHPQIDDREVGLAAPWPPPRRRRDRRRSRRRSRARAARGPAVRGTPRRRRRAGSRLPPSSRRPRDRQPERRGRPGAGRRTDGELAPQPLDDGARQEDPQPHPLSGRLGGEERLADPGQELGRDPGAAIGDLEDQPPAVDRRRPPAG